MNIRYIPLLALLTLTAAAHVNGAPPAKNAVRTQYQAVETDVGSVTLPTGLTGSLIVIPCPGCAPKTFQAIATTQYLLGERVVTSAELRKAVLGRSKAPMNLIYDQKTNELYSITADVGPSAVPSPAKAGRNRQPAR